MGGRECLRGPILMLLYLLNNGRDGVNRGPGRGHERLSGTLLLLLLLCGRSVLAFLAPFSALLRWRRKSKLRGFRRRDVAEPAVVAVLAGATLRKLEAVFRRAPRRRTPVVSTTSLGLLPPALPPLPPLFPTDLGAGIAPKSLRATMVWENQQVVLPVASSSLALEEKPPSG